MAYKAGIDTKTVQIPVHVIERLPATWDEDDLKIWVAEQVADTLPESARVLRTRASRNGGVVVFTVEYIHMWAQEVF